MPDTCNPFCPTVRFTTMQLERPSPALPEGQLHSAIQHVKCRTSRRPSCYPARQAGVNSCCLLCDSRTWAQHIEENPPPFQGENSSDGLHLLSAKSFRYPTQSRRQFRAVRSCRTRVFRLPGNLHLRSIEKTYGPWSHLYTWGGIFCEILPAQLSSYLRPRSQQL